tara:strand:- start:990 stop:1586 length:597 start_codon:yes stop_codon:yes gene_type:complete
MANLTSFKNKIGYGIRPNLFMVQVTNLESNLDDVPAVKGTDADFTFLCRSAGIPASTIGTVEVPFRGRVIKLPGDRTFESWTITVMADEDMSVRAYFEKWMNKLNKHENGAGYTEDFASTLKVSQLERGTSTSSALVDPHSIVRSYEFMNAFPTNIAQIDLSYDNNNTIAEYTVEFQYDWWESSTADSTVDIGASSTI